MRVYRRRRMEHGMGTHGVGVRRRVGHVEGHGMGVRMRASRPVELRSRLRRRVLGRMGRGVGYGAGVRMHRRRRLGHGVGRHGATGLHWRRLVEDGVGTHKVGVRSRVGRSTEWGARNGCAHARAGTWETARATWRVGHGAGSHRACVRRRVGRRVSPDA